MMTQKQRFKCQDFSYSSGVKLLC